MHVVPGLPGSMAKGLNFSPSAPDPLARLRVVLCAPSHPGNIGAAARAMKTMGVSRLFLVQPRRHPSTEATALASGAGDVLAAARVCDSLDAAIADCVASYGFTARTRELVGRMLPVREAAAQAVATCEDGEVALVFGHETSGLSNAELERCSVLAYIPANESYPSLNLGAAVQVACYESRLAVGESARTAPRFAPATHADIEKLYAHAERTLVELAFLNPRRPRRLLPRLRRLFARTGLEHEEVNILRGMLAAIDTAIARAAPRAGEAPPQAPESRR